MPEEPSPYLNNIRPQVSKAGFSHPGVFVGLPELEFVRRKIAAGEEPWTGIYDQLRSGSPVTIKPEWSLFRDARSASRGCDPASRQGCVLDCYADECKKRLSGQINSAYGNALLWYYSGDGTYAQRAVTMLNAYGHTFRGFTNPDGNHTRILFAAWTAQTLVRAAEIIRYTYRPTGGATAFDAAAFGSMVRTAFLPEFEPELLQEYKVVNNWRTSVVEGLMNSAIYLDNRGLYERAVRMWRGTTRSYIYISSDGRRANPFPDNIRPDPHAQDCYWAHGLSDACQNSPNGDPRLVYQNGQNMEICRDMWHAAAGLGGIIDAAETARLQGDDLYAVGRSRIMPAISYLLEIKQRFASEGYPSNFCANAEKYGKPGINGEPFPKSPGDIAPLADVVAYNHYATRKGYRFPALRIPGYPAASGDPVAAYIARYQSGPTDDWGFIVAWQTLTHFGVGLGISADAAPAPSASPSASRTPRPSPGSPTTGRPTTSRPTTSPTRTSQPGTSRPTAGHRTGTVPSRSPAPGAGRSARIPADVARLVWLVALVIAGCQVVLGLAVLGWFLLTRARRR